MRAFVVDKEERDTATDGNRAHGNQYPHQGLGLGSGLVEPGVDGLVVLGRPVADKRLLNVGCGGEACGIIGRCHTCGIIGRCYTGVVVLLGWSYKLGLVRNRDSVVGCFGATSGTELVLGLEGGATVRTEFLRHDWLFFCGGRVGD